MSKLPPTSRTILRVIAVSLLLFGAVAPVTSTVGHPGTDNTVTRIDVQTDGSARWTVHIRTRLDTDESVENYERFQGEFRANESGLFDPFKSRIERIVGRAGNATGRPMAATNFSATTSIQAVPRRWGVVTFAFTWEEFAERRDDELVVGDAFESGLYIAENDSLKISGPDGYGVADVRPDPGKQQDGTVTWSGRRDFTDNRPHVRYAPSSGGTHTGDADTNVDVFGVVPLVGGVLLLALVGGGVAYRLRRDDETPASTGSEPEPVTDEERVLQMLESSGGRMKQNDIVARVDWSKSKVSRLTGKLSDEGLVRKTQIGRENVVELDRDPDEE